MLVADRISSVAVSSSPAVAVALAGIHLRCWWWPCGLYGSRLVVGA